MKPITRKELYLNKIVGNNDYEIPEKPITTEEFFFAAILGEAVQVPEPLTRYQMYLAKIAGRNISVPKPLTRLELFLAKACGMDIETPTPITREEIFWSNYTAIVYFEVEGVPPLTYKAIEGTLENYRIYGNTVDGESVGDRTRNLFDGEVEQGSFNGSTGEETNSNIRVRSGKVRLTADNYTINADGVSHGVVYVYALNGDFIRNKSITTWAELPANFEIDISYDVRFCFRKNDNSTLIPSDIMNIMLNSGSTALPYEPYGYKVPVTVSNGTDTLTTPIYLPEQIKKVGDEAEYIDYGEQKQYFADGTSVDVTLPALPTLTGTNVLSVGTAVQPSKVYIKGEKEREYT